MLNYSFESRTKSQEMAATRKKSININKIKQTKSGKVL